MASSSIAARATTAGRSVYRLATCQRKTIIAAAAHNAQRIARRKPVRQARRASAGSPAPSQKLTRALVAIANDSGNMYATAVRFAAIWCEAEATVPSRAMNSAISVNDVTSTSTARPAGTPSCAKRPSARRSGGSTRRHSS